MDKLLSEQVKPMEQHSHQISSALKERLKKCGRYHTSPLAESARSDSSSSLKVGLAETPMSKRKNITTKAGVALKKRKLEYDKRSEIGIECLPDTSQCVAENHEETNQDDAKKRIYTDDENKLQPAKVNCLHESLVEDKKQKLLSEKRQLEIKLIEKNEALRKLKMVKMYREKNNLSELQVLINTWRDVSQKALIDLHNLLPHPKPTLMELIKSMHIDTELIHYNADEEGFT